MPRYTTRIPKYRRHKPSGQAVVTLSGHDVYLGKYGTPESKAEYHRLVAEWQFNARAASPSLATSDRTIDEVIAAYLAHARQYYRKDGKPTSSLEEAHRSVRPLHAQYGLMAVSEFGPLTLKAVRQSMMDRGNWCRTTINRAVDVIKRMFKWAAENELVPAEIYHRLQTVLHFTHLRQPAGAGAGVHHRSAADAAHRRWSRAHRGRVAPACA